MNELIRTPEFTPDGYQPKDKPEIISMVEQTKYLTDVETFIEKIKYEGIDFEIIERPDVLWVGSMGFHENDYNADPSELVKKIMPLWGDFFKNVILADKNEGPNLPANGVLTFNMRYSDLPNGMMIATETYKTDHDPKYSLYTQPAGLYIRLKIDETSAQLIGKDKCEPYELYRIMKKVALQNGYEECHTIINGISLEDFEYHDGAPAIIHAYIPVKRIETTDVK